MTFKKTHPSLYIKNVSINFAPKTKKLFKKLSIYIFITLYIVAMLRPIAPLVEYVINYDYISKVLCINKDTPELKCNGKCQLMKKLQQQQDDDFNSLQVNMKEYPVGFVNLLNFNQRKIIPTDKLKIFSSKNNYFYVYNSEVFHPPTFPLSTFNT